MIRKPSQLYKDFIEGDFNVLQLCDKYGFSSVAKLQHKLNKEITVNKILENYHLNQLRVLKNNITELTTPSFEGVKIYQTVGAWNNKYQLNQYKILKEIKNGIR